MPVVTQGLYNDDGSLRVTPDYGAGQGAYTASGALRVTGPAFNAPKRKLVTLGTSLVQHNHVATSTKISDSNRGWATWLKVLNPGRFDYDVWSDTADAYSRNYYGANHGVSGQTSLEIEARLPQVAAMKPDVVILDIGTNDVGSLTSAQIQETTNRVVAYLQNIGAQVVLLPILARGTSVTNYTSASQSRKTALDINNRRRLLAGERGYIFHDWNEAWVNRSDTDGNPQTDFSIDGIHFNPKGAFAVASQMSNLVNQLFPYPRFDHISSPEDLYDATYNPYGIISPNPYLIGTSGANGTGSSGTIATSWRVERTSGSACTSVGSLVARTNNGNWQQLVITKSGDTEETFLFRTSTADTTTTLSAGDWVQAFCDVEFDGGSGLMGLDLYCKDQPSGIIGYGMEPYNPSTRQEMSATAFSGRLVTPAYQILADNASQRIRVEIYVKGASGDLTLRFGRIGFRKVESPKIKWNK